MTDRARVLTMGLLLVLSGCGRLSGVAPSATEALEERRAERSAAGYQTQQLTARFRDFLLRRRMALAVEAAVFDMVNAERARASLPALTHVTALRNVARSHSLDMAGKGYFDHNTPEGKTPADRLTAAGITFSQWAENIRWVSAPRTNVANDLMYEAGTGWMNSSGHRANILNPTVTQVGVGVYLNPSRTRWYATQVFIRP